MGTKPDADVCSRFLGRVSKPAAATMAPVSKPLSDPSVKEQKRPYGTHTQGRQHRFSFVFKGQTYESGSAAGVMREVFRLLAKEDPDFLEKFAALKTWKKAEISGAKSRGTLSWTPRHRRKVVG